MASHYITCLHHTNLVFSLERMPQKEFGEKLLEKFTSLELTKWG